MKRNHFGRYIMDHHGDIYFFESSKSFESFQPSTVTGRLDIRRLATRSKKPTFGPLREGSNWQHPMGNSQEEATKINQAGIPRII